MKTKRRMLLGGLVPAVVSALVLSACSSSGGSTPPAGNDSGDSTSGSSGTGATGKPIVIGNVGSYAGPYASQDGARQAVNAWGKWVNAHGGINGRPVKLIIEDDGGSATTALTAVKKLVEQDKVVALVGVTDNFVSGWISYADQKGIPIIGGNPIESTAVTDPNYFPAGGNFLAINYGVLAAAKDQGLTKMALLYCSESPACAASAKVFGPLGKSLGVDIAYSGGISATAPNYTSTCQALKSSGAQAVKMAAQAPVVIKVADTCKQQGVDVVNIASSGTINDNFLQSPALKNFLGVQANFPWIDDSIPATQEWHDALKQYAPNIGVLLNGFASSAWVGAKLFETVAKTVKGDITSDSLKQALYDLPDGETLGGLAPPLTFVKDKPTIVNCYFTINGEDGKYTASNGLKTGCAPDDVIESTIKSLGLSG